MKGLLRAQLLCSLLLLGGCLGMPDNVTPVQDFEPAKYMGEWYEVARLDHSFERGLTQVTAQYALREDGGVQVTNRGFSSEEGEWREALGKAFFVNNPGEGYLKVSFFGPFYGSYVIYALDDDYQHAFVSGPDTSYLWFLSRTPVVEEAVMERFIEQADSLGFDVSKLIFPAQLQQ